MMKNRVWPLLLVFSGLSLCAKHGTHDAMVIEHDLIRVVDAGQIDLIKLLRLQQDIQNILEGEKNKAGDKVTGLIFFDGKHYSARQLAQLELTQKGKKDKELQVALMQAFSLVQAATEDYMNEARGYKRYMKRIIKRWSEMRKRADTTLLDWEHQADGKEHEQLKQLIHNFKELELFLDDLSRFLADLSYSCKNTWKKFKKQLKERDL